MVGWHRGRGKLRTILRSCLPDTKKVKLKIPNPLILLIKMQQTCNLKRTRLHFAFLYYQPHGFIMDKPELAPKKKRGRPKKQEVMANSPGGRNKVGRPKGDAAIINEYKSRMLASPKSRRVLDTIFEAAMDDDHRNQAAAWKLVMDRILPVAAFEKDVIKDGGRSAIQINITGVGTAEVKDATIIEGSSDEILQD